MNHQIATYDFNVDFNKYPDRLEFEKHLRQWCKKYTFQKEKGDTGYVHWQGRVSLIKKRRPTELAKSDFMKGGFVTATHDAQTNFYVTKADTRIEGPWSDKDYEEPPILTRQLRYFNTQRMYEWQKQVLSMCLEEDDRSIKLIYDQLGNNGKSIMCEYLEYHKYAYEIPPFRLMEDIMACAMAIKTQKCYLIDMPRALKKDKLGEFYSGLESLKNGVCYDKRYNFKKRRMDRPQVIVFTNTLPKWELMSRDRWEVYEMGENNTLSHLSQHDLITL